jgi:hypothetical protein
MSTTRFRSQEPHRERRWSWDRFGLDLGPDMGERMTLRVVGAGVGRTGTLSLKAGLEELLGHSCYHMIEVFSHPDHVAVWRDAAEGRPVDWQGFLENYEATSDFPACLFWREILDAHPDAIVVLSTRRDSEAWWQSASQTIFSFDADQMPPEMKEWFEMWQTVAQARFTADWKDERAARAAYERHNAEVRASAPRDRLVEWSPADGWGPLCLALAADVPDTPFPHLNKREDFPKLEEADSVSDALERLTPGAPAGG